MTDILEQLRGIMSMDDDVPVDECIAEIERLRLKITQLEQDSTELQAVEDEIERLRGENRRKDMSIAGLRVQIDELREDNAELREALGKYAEPTNWTSQSGLIGDPQDCFALPTDYSYVDRGWVIARKALGLPDAP